MAGTVTEWVARRVGDRMLCGRRGAHTGRYICDGFVAGVSPVGDRDNQDMVFYPNGYVEGPPGWFLPSARSSRKGGRPRLRRPRMEPGLDTEPRWPRQGMVRQTRTRCQLCGTTAVVPVL
ncbi:hypothetical protein BH23CHL7_BH23CHL7_20820 [soil metagenome]